MSGESKIFRRTKIKGPGKEARRDAHRRRHNEEEIKRRFKVYYEGDEKRHLPDTQIPYLRKKWSNLSEYVKEIEQGFSRFYNSYNRFAIL